MNAFTPRDFLVRPERPEDRETVRAVLLAAFPTPAEAELVRRVEDQKCQRVALVAERDGRVVGQILFCGVTIETEWGSLSALALAPVAVHPECQGRGIGSELIRRGLDHCRDAGHAIVFVLGDPSFYRRFGFSRGRAAALDCEYQCDGFLVLELEPDALEGIAGRVVYPPPFAGL